MIAWQTEWGRQVLAHAGEHDVAGSLWTAWTWDPGVLVGIGLAGTLYAFGLRRSSGARRVLPTWRVVCFYAGLAVLFLAQQSPLHALAEDLFMMHMVQHMAVMLLAAPLLLLGAPVVPLLRGLPEGLRRDAAIPILRWRGSRRVMRLFALPLGALLVFSSVFSVWHMPALYDAALENSGIHAFQHLTFLVSALLFWWNVIDPVPLRPRLSYPMRLLYIFVAGIPSALLGAVLAFSSQPWYSFYLQVPERVWNVGVVDDQRIGGLIMWVPGSLVFLLAAVVIAVVMLMRAEREEQAAMGLVPSPTEQGDAL